MTEEQQRQIDIQNLKKHQEFWSLKKELELFCDRLDSIADIDLSEPKRVSLAEEIYGRSWASKQIRELLYSFGLVELRTKKIDRTME